MVTEMIYYRVLPMNSLAFTKTNSKGKPNNKLKRYHEAKFVAKFLGTVVVHCWAITGQNEAGEPENPDPDLYKGP